jgi:hypothetical protein
MNSWNVKEDLELSSFKETLQNKSFMSEDFDFLESKEIVLENKLVLDFLGDSNESTEIDSIVVSLDQSNSVNIDLNSIKQDSSCEEILTILKQKSTPFSTKNESRCENPFALRKPIVVKKIAMGGKILQTSEQQTSTQTSPCRPVPQRVSNPIYKNLLC